MTQTRQPQRTPPLPGTRRAVISQANLCIITLTQLVRDLEEVGNAANGRNSETKWSDGRPRPSTETPDRRAGHHDKHTAGDGCPECGDEMRERVSAYGKFFGCVNYPTCKGKRGAGRVSTVRGAMSQQSRRTQ
jgi:hypothetical protein